MKIALCEDILEHRELLVARIRAWSEATSCTLAIHEYTNAHDFFAVYKKQAPFDVFFLDIDLSHAYWDAAPAAVNNAANPVAENVAAKPAEEKEGEKEGLAIAAWVREQDANATIVFTTSNTQHVFRGYKVQAFDYLLKPVSEHDVSRVLNYVDQQRKYSGGQILVITTNTETKRIELDKVCFFRSQLQWVELHCVEGVDTFRGRFSDIIAEVEPRGFINCHRSYVVNPAFIKAVTKDTICLNDGFEIPVARAKRKDVIDAWLTWSGKDPRALAISPSERLAP